MNTVLLIITVIYVSGVIGALIGSHSLNLSIRRIIIDSLIWPYWSIVGWSTLFCKSNITIHRSRKIYKGNQHEKTLY